jgi:hypothetical protein
MPEQFLPARFGRNNTLYNRLRDSQGLDRIPDTYEVAVQPNGGKRNWFAVTALALAGVFILTHLLGGKKR